MGMSGFPFVGADIGGFAEAPTPDLFTRWLQVGVFYPFMRTHTAFGTPDQEPWSYGAEHEAINRRAIELRYQLLPYIYSVMRESADSGLPAMRAMLLEYPQDEGAAGNADQFFFGSDLLIAPVLREAATTRGVYLPAGDWYDYWSGEHYVGPKSFDIPVTLASIPIFVRGGAFIFTQPVVQHTGEMPGQPLIVNVFPAASSERWLYEDAGNGFGPSLRRRFSARTDGSGTTIEVTAPEGTYRPQSRSIMFTVRAIAKAVSVNGKPLPSTDWTSKDGVITIKMPDRFERMEIRID